MTNLYMGDEDIDDYTDENGVSQRDTSPTKTSVKSMMILIQTKQIRLGKIRVN